MLHEVMDFNLQIPANAILFSILAGTLLGGLRAAEYEENDTAGGEARLFLFRDPRERRKERRSLASLTSVFDSAGSTSVSSRTGHARTGFRASRLFTFTMRVAGVLLTLAVTLAAFRAWREFRGRALMAQYRASSEVDYRQADDPEAVIASRIELLRRALALGSVDGEAGAALAVEMVNGANAHVLAGQAADANGKAEVMGRMQQARSAVADSLHSSPLNTEGWLAGYRVVTSSILLGLPELVSQAEGGRPLSPLSPPAQEGALSRAGVETPSNNGAAAAIAERFVRGAVSRDPNGGPLHRDLADLMVAAGDPRGALAQYRQAGRDPSVDAVEMAQRMLDSGFEASEVLDAMPARGPALCGTARLLQERGRSDLAEKAWLRATQLPDAWSDPWTALSHFAESQGRHEQALAYAKSAFPLLPALPRGARSEVLFCAAMASRSLGQIDRALEFGADALRDNPQHLYLYNFLGSLLLERGDAAGAIRQWETLIDRYPNDPYVSGNLALFHRMIGRAYERLGLRASAVDHYVEALRASPADAESKAGLARLSAP